MNDPVAEFLAKGGKITKVEAGASTVSEREMYDRVRGNTPKFSMPDDVDDEQYAEMEMEAVSQAAMIGGRAAAIQTMNDMRSARRGKVRRDKHRDYEAQARYNEQWGVDY